MRLHRLVLPTISVAVLGLTACGQASTGGGAASATGGGSGVILVTATDTACTVATTSAPTGTVTFRVTNSGTKVNEFYVYGPGDRVVAEVENITPGLTRELTMEATEPGTLQTACKPGMVGDGIRADFVVTGAAKAASSDEKVATSIAAYTAYVVHEAGELVDETEKFVAAVKAGKVAEAKSLYPQARKHWEEIEPVAESFGELDRRIDGREDVVAQGAAFTGFHRLEKDLWASGLQPDSSAVADQLLLDVRQIKVATGTVKLTALSIANGAKALLDEVATGKVTGEEERYSHTDLWDFDANLEGSKSAIGALRPVLQARDAALVSALDTRFAALETLLDSHKQGDGFLLYTALSPDQVKALTVALDALSEQVARVPAVLDHG